jgi:hypothetical protein
LQCTKKIAIYTLGSPRPEVPEIVAKESTPFGCGDPQNIRPRATGGAATIKTLHNERDSPKSK